MAAATRATEVMTAAAAAWALADRGKSNVKANPLKREIPHGGESLVKGDYHTG